MGRLSVLNVFWLLFAAGGGFWMYSAGRTWAETFGPSLEGLRTGLLLCVIFVMGPLLWLKFTTYLIAPQLRLKFVRAALAMTFACIAAELWVIADEQAFRREVRRPNPELLRNRWWPNGSCQVFFDPQTGFHATE